MKVSRTISCRLKSSDTKKGIIYGEVYAPYQMDTYGEFMTPQDIELMAHRFAKLDWSAVIDLQHDNRPILGAHPVESFVARDGDPEFTAGAWVLGVKVPAEYLEAVEHGEINGFSFQAMIVPVEMEVDVEVMRHQTGVTQKAEGPQEAPHDHFYFLEMDDMGQVTGGRTSKAADGHFHTIAHASMTEVAKAHSHRYFLGD